ncbi:DUF262 domain-containing protein [Rhodopseudomonas telluris]|uniref:DUF262 domain-containing protein n=1 Tax=Rhodopseudomonas telluris TaxID=644215 RepID=A0ABV6EMB2_9BRAD
MRNQNSVLKSFHDAQAQLVVQTADLPLGTLAGMVDSGAIDLQPGFQRRERWSPEKQAALIESFLLNVPVPPVYLAEEEIGTYTAIDGKQRLRAIADFIANRFSLRHLERLQEVEGLYFRDLPAEITNALMLRPFLRVVTLLKQTNTTLKYEVFLRLNRGGETLNPQEIRNVAFRGAMNEAIYALADQQFLRKQLKITDEKSSAFRSMSDAEYVLRFLTLEERSENFSGSLVREMDDFMERHQNAGTEQVQKSKDLFSTAIGRCEHIWGDHAFKRPEGNGWRDQLLAGMYDAQMISVSRLSVSDFAKAANKSEKVISGTRKLFTDDEFDKAVRTGTNTPARIAYRIEAMTELLSSV